jgi:hypothetical protein
MVVRLIEGFEVERITGHWDRRYAVVTGAPTFPAGYKDLNGFAAQSNSLELTTKALTTTLQNSWTIGFAFKMVEGLTTGQTTYPEVVFLDGPLRASDDQIALRFVAQTSLASEVSRAKIEVVRGGTVLGTSDTVFLRNRWYYIEFQVTIHPTLGSYEVKVDEVSDAGATDTSGTVNTANQGTAGADRYHMSWESDSGNDDVAYDQIICGDDSTFRGKIVVEGLRSIDGDGDQADWALAGGASNVGDALLDADNQVSASLELQRITSSTVNDVSFADHENLVLIRDGTIYGIRLTSVGRMETSGTRGVTPRFRDKDGAPAEADGTEYTLTDTSFESWTEMFVNNPVSAAAWQVSEVDLGQWGVKVTT